MRLFYLQGNHYYGGTFKKKYIHFTDGIFYFLPQANWFERSINLGHLKEILRVFEDCYLVETGYRKVPNGGYIPEYKLSIPRSQAHNRINRFKMALTVLAHSQFETQTNRIRRWVPCQSIRFLNSPQNHRFSPLLQRKRSRCWSNQIPQILNTNPRLSPKKRFQCS